MFCRARSYSSTSPVLDELKYLKGIQHWAGSSTQEAECVVEPGTTADVGTVVRRGSFSSNVAEADNFNHFG